jgi:D-glycero-D-manno-heptose 1,7-bisphosphate phosphatase
MGVGSTLKAVFLDRDGVLNQADIRKGKPYPPDSIDDVIIPEGVVEGLAKLKLAGYLLVMVTNQPDVARGKTTKETVDEINSYLRQKLGLDDVYCCYHDSKDRCSCRKPKPGMILVAKEKWDIDLSRSFMVGDRWRDIETGNNAGVKTILIPGDYDEKRVEPDYVCKDFYQVAQLILKNNKNEL